MPPAPPAVRALCLAAVTLLGLAPTAAADDSWSVVPSAGGQDGRPYFYAEGASARFVPWGAVAGTAAGLVLCAGGCHWFVRRRRRPRETGGAEQPCAEVELTGAVM